MTVGRLTGVGVGPGDPELLTLKAARLIGEADVIAYPATETGDSLARRIAAPHIPNGRMEIPIVIPIQTGTHPDERVYDAAADQLSAEISQGRSVVVLCEGDPFFYGSFMYLFGRMAATATVDVVPGVSSPMACAAAVGSPLVSRNDILTISQAAASGHSARKPPRGDRCGRHHEAGAPLCRMQALLARLGLSDRAHHVERATMDTQRILPLDALDPDTVPYFSMILVHRRGEGLGMTALGAKPAVIAVSVSGLSVGRRISRTNWVLRWKGAQHLRIGWSTRPHRASASAFWRWHPPYHRGRARDRGPRSGSARC